MSAEAGRTPGPYPIDERYGYIHRPDEFMRMYLQDTTVIQPNLYYRIVGAEVTMVIGRELIAFAPALERRSLALRLWVSASAAIIAIGNELRYGLALYGRYWIPIATIDSSS